MNAKKNIKKKRSNKEVIKITSPPKPKTVDYIFEPSWSKIFLVILMSSILILSWINLIKENTLSFLNILYFLIFSSIWILSSLIASCIFIYLTSKNRITKSLGFLIVCLLTIFLGTVIYVTI